MLKLSILIPTYNRAQKLIRMLENIETEIARSDAANFLEVIVSDNASPDETKIAVEEFIPNGYKIRYFRQDVNVGFDRNIKFLYEQAKGDYVWYVSDDDILLPGAMQEVVNGLKETNPDVLLFSFEQPLGSTNRTFDLPESVSLVTNPEKIIELAAHYPKVTMYVVRKIDLTQYDWAEIEPFCGDGYFFVILCYSILARSDQARLTVISKPLATCDDDFSHISFSPYVVLNFYRVFLHPFVQNYLPNLANYQQQKSYFDSIQLMFAIKVGTLTTDNEKQFNKDLNSFKMIPGYLALNPRPLAQLFLLKTNLTQIYKFVKIAKKLLSNNKA
jgi:glycosyltransferase involved in cell wall biosynthesis